MRKFIHVTKRDREFLSSAFGVTERTVYNACNFVARGDDRLMRRIRKLALQRGGILMAEGSVVDMMFDNDGYLRQYFANDAMMELSYRGDGSCDVWHKGEKVRHYEDVKLSDIDSIRSYAISLR